jgi:hypothetical protein
MKILGYGICQRCLESAVEYQTRWPIKKLHKVVVNGIEYGEWCDWDARIIKGRLDYPNRPEW